MVKPDSTGKKKRRKARLAAWSIIGVGLLLMAVSAWLAYLGRSVEVPEEFGPWYGSLIFVLPFALTMLIAGAIIQKLPHNPFGWVFLVLGFSFGVLIPVGTYYGIYALMASDPPLPFAWQIAALGGLGWLTGAAMMPLVLLLFPTGAPPEPRWRFLIPVIGAAYLLGTVLIFAVGGEGLLPLEDPNTVTGPLADILILIGYLGVVTIYIAILLSFVSLIVRYRRADRMVRQQVKWLIFGAALFVAILISDFYYTLPGIWEQVKEAVMFAPIPAAIGVAILRYRLYDIDIIIRRTLVYTVLTGLLALVYFGTVTVLQSAFQFASGQTSTLALVLSTLGIAALFNPLRRRIQEFIDRRFYRQKYNAEQALEGFAALARSETNLRAITDRLVSVVQETVQPEQISLWLRPASFPIQERKA